ncbi:extracellular solute-binding protein [Isoptericola sp. b441]|uniref:Extracellular solute-binding protein n=1 Tax=Actinotalea lenta TaxID=3064654 RepID=A0ABT9D8P5_9CELL|nr:MULTISPECIES: extracellular solute-binding protein [unclassified Isoptericola]MDO8107269.1 extracellular solute-binding protein [Isoptericola sp. b441]MDO8121068.1 extracellular solute-binding protein [Isoptericola sp. b490]
MRMRNTAALAVAAGLVLGLGACGGVSTPGSSAAGSSSADAGPAGEITFLTNRTDLQQDGTFDGYVTEFQKTYPNVNVKVEGITNYADDVRTRMSTPNGYGDVLMIPPSVPANEFQTFFEPLGSVSDLAATYRFQAPASYDGTQYGIALGGNANGVLYNTKVWADAGITELPTSPDAFLADLAAIKASTSAIPLYTNYKDGWPLGGQWFSNVGAISGDVNAQNEMAHDPAPWTPGKDVYVIDSLLFDAVAKGLTESDPLTTNWEQSKGDFATGKIATMVLGSWAISQFQAAAKDAGVDPSVVGFMAFPATAPDGKQYATIGGDYNLAINVNSKNKDAARAWMDFLLQKSGFTDSQGMISALKDAPLPANLASLSDNDVTLIEPAPAPAGEEGLLNSVADKSKVDVWGNIYRQKLVDVARGQASGDKASFFADLNARWAKAVQELAS